MKQKLLVVALLSSLPLFANAQSNVTMYGMLDASIGVEKTGVPGTDSRTVVSSGTQSASRLGFRGTEDLGNGLKALFNIEAAINGDTGTTSSTFFGRRAVVGLQGDFGTLTVGREYGPSASVAGASDILGQGFYGSNLAAFEDNSRLTRRLSNSVNYKSNAVSGFTLGAAYGAGENNVDNQPSGDIVGLSLEYANAGFYAGGAYQKNEGTVTIAERKEYNIGLGYKFGDFELRGGYMVADPEAFDNKYEQMNFGGSYTMGANKFFVNYQQQELEVGDAKGRALTLAYAYTLSKRTNVYVSAAKLRNNDNAVFGLTSPASTIAPTVPAGVTGVSALGADPHVFNVGVRHSF